MINLHAINPRILVNLLVKLTKNEYPIGGGHGGGLYAAPPRSCIVAPPTLWGPALWGWGKPQRPMAHGSCQRLPLGWGGEIHSREAVAGGVLV